MSNRDYKEFAEGEYYHIYNRGNGKMDIFRDEQDFQNFLKRLRLVLGLETVPTPGRREATKVPFEFQRAPLIRIMPLPKDAFTIVCYCLMPNHFHLLLRQNKEVPASKLISKLCTSYGKYFNRKYKRVGGLFQDQFKSVLIDNDNYLKWLSAYIHQNPKVAGLVRKVEEWPWSSYHNFISGRGDIIADADVVLGDFKNVDEYKKFVESSFEIIKEKKDDMESIMID